MQHSARPCPHCIAGNRINAFGHYTRCNHRPPCYTILHPLAVIIAAIVDFCRGAYHGN